jgi:hypothetical protein
MLLAFNLVIAPTFRLKCIAQIYLVITAVKAPAAPDSSAAVRRHSGTRARKVSGNSKGSEQLTASFRLLRQLSVLLPLRLVPGCCCKC